MSDEATTFTMFLAGRDIEFRRAGLGQLMILERMYHRRMKQAAEDDKGNAFGSVIAKTLDFIDTLIVHEQDRQFVEDEMLAGTISWQEIMKALGGGQEKVADDQAPVTPKKAPRKSPTAASAAKKTISRAGTKH